MNVLSGGDAAVVKNLDLSEGTSGFPHAMLAEIFQQPQALRDTLAYYLRDKSLNGEAFTAAHSALLGHERLVIAASGSSRPRRLLHHAL